MTFMDHLPILVVIIPLLTAPLCVLFNRPVLAWFVSVSYTHLTLPTITE